PRRGNLLTRLAAWPALRDVVRAETTGLADHDWVVVDPDSPLTQRNLLPLAPDAQTRYFPKGTFAAPDAERLAEIPGAWAQPLPGLAGRPRPTIWLSDETREWAGSLRRGLAGHAPRWAVVNLGMGGNPRKGMGPVFEEHLVRRLVAGGLGVLLARGVSDDEVE